MGGFSSKEVKDITETTHPYFDQYLKCQSRAFTLGLGYCAFSACGLYVGCRYIRNYVKFNPSLMVLVPIGGAQLSAYLVTRSMTKQCQQMWLASEDKHSLLDQTSES